MTQPPRTTAGEVAADRPGRCRRRPRTASAAVTLGVVLLSSACSSAVPEGGGAAGTVAATAGGGEVAAVRVPPEAGHVHGLGKDPGSGALLVASHGGLFTATGAGFTRVGPLVDLMGFTVVAPGHYYASGHPQPGTDLPQPVGLIETRDGGATWTVLSRGGRSDFHAITPAGVGVAAFDDALRVTTDLRRWEVVPLAPAPISLAGAPGDDRVVASTRSGVMTSADAGRTWAEVADSPAPALLSRAEDAVVAVAADGRVLVADPAGRTWAPTRLRTAPPLAVLATGPRDALEVVVLTEDGLVVSRSGAPFGPWAPAP